jgi:hypothetical protein
MLTAVRSLTVVEILGIGAGTGLRLGQWSTVRRARSLALLWALAVLHSTPIY